MNPILECVGLSKKYNNNFYALNNLNLTLEQGQIVGLLGPNGSGKTTLIKLINDALIPTQGKVLIDGKEPGVATKKMISYLPERTYLDADGSGDQCQRPFKDLIQRHEGKSAADSGHEQGCKAIHSG